MQIYVYIIIVIACIMLFCILVYTVLIDESNDGITQNMTLAMRMATAPLLEMFNSSKDDWNAWSRRFGQLLTLSSYSTSDDTAAKKLAAFCTYIDSATFKPLCSLCAPRKPEVLPFKELKAKLDSQYGTKKLVLTERYRFYNYRQLDRQSLPDYIAELR